MSIKIKSIGIVGGGEMGCEIAIQCAYSGFNVTVFDIAEDAQTMVKQRLDRMVTFNTNNGTWSSQDAEKAHQNLSITTNLTDLANVDLINESVFEDLAVKKDIWSKLANICSEHTIFTTNSSSLRPSEFAQSTGRPKRFAALHFHLTVSRIVDVMNHGSTDKEVMDTLEAFVPNIGLIPLRLEKEHPQYVLNSMIIGIQQIVGDLLVGEFTNYQDIDRCWMDFFNAPYGPCGLMDAVGLDTVASIMAAKKDNEKAQKFATYLQEKVAQGHCGVKTGQGFYSYPDPKFSQASFIENK